MESLFKELGYKSEALVHRNITPLLEYSLIDRENWKNQGGTPGAEKQLLTDLGAALYERIVKYNEFKTKQ